MFATNHVLRATLTALVLSACSSTPPTPDASADAGVDAPLDAPRDVAIADSEVDTARDATTDAAVDAALEPCASWCTSDPLPSVLQEIAAVTLGDRIIVVGGFEGPSAVGTVRTYAPDEGWGLLPSLPEPRHHVGLGAHEGDLYVLGGMRDGGFEPVDTAFVLREGAESWQPIANLPSPRAAGVAAQFGDLLLLAAGQGEGRSAPERMDAAADVFIYNTATDAWTRGATMPVPSEHVAGVFDGSELWVFGGRELRLEPTSAIVQVYDAENDRWRMGPEMPYPRGGFAAALHDGMAYVTGGEERDEALSTAHVLNLRTESWGELPTMLSPRHGHAMAALSGEVYAIGGADRPIFAAIDSVERLTP